MFLSVKNEERDTFFLKTHVGHPRWISASENHRHVPVPRLCEFQCWYSGIRSHALVTEIKGAEYWEVKGGHERMWLRKSISFVQSVMNTEEGGRGSLWRGGVRPVSEVLLGWVSHEVVTEEIWGIQTPLELPKASQRSGLLLVSGSGNRKLESKPPNYKIHQWFW